MSSTSLCTKLLRRRVFLHASCQLQSFADASHSNSAPFSSLTSMLQSHVPLIEDVREPSRENVWKPDHYKENREKRTRHENIKMGYQHDIAEAWTAGKHRIILQVYERSRYVIHLFGTDNIHRPEIATTVCDFILLLTSLAELSSFCKNQEKRHIATNFWSQTCGYLYHTHEGTDFAV